MGAPKGSCKGHAPYPGCEKGGETGGRPKRYTPEFCDEEGEHLEKWLKEDKDNMFIQNFCLKRGYPVFKIGEMVKASTRFRQAYDMWRTKQQSNLFAGGLSKKFAHPMCALILSHVHDIHAKTETKVENVNKSVEDLLSEIDGQSKDLVHE